MVTGANWPERFLAHWTLVGPLILMKHAIYLLCSVNSPVCA